MQAEVLYYQVAKSFGKGQVVNVTFATVLGKNWTNCCGISTNKKNYRAAEGFLEAIDKMELCRPMQKCQAVFRPKKKQKSDEHEAISIIKSAGLPRRCFAYGSIGEVPGPGQSVGLI